jgi:putative transcriptional regulator
MKTRLRVLRAGKEWSQEDLATKVGVTRQTINAIETGKYEASLSLALKIAHLFGMHVDDIFLLPEKDLPRPVKHEVLFRTK